MDDKISRVQGRELCVAVCRGFARLLSSPKSGKDLALLPLATLIDGIAFVA